MKSSRKGAAGVGVRGNLLRWARTEQGLTMQQVRARGGPCPGYQSEVEKGIKAEVRHDLLGTWSRILGITVSFARGEVPRFTRDPAACRGLAGYVGDLVRNRPGWADLGPPERTRQVLLLIPDEGERLPRVVLAYVLNLTVETLDAMMTGRHPIMETQMRAISELTTLPGHFFQHGDLDEENLLGSYLPALRAAQKAGIGPERLADLILKL